MSVSFRDWLSQNRHRRVELAALGTVLGEWITAEELHGALHHGGADSHMCVLLTMFKDMWLGMTDQWEYDCSDCGTDSTDERYMVRDDVWAAAGMCPFGFLCIGCIEQRLGRRLAAADFLDLPLNLAPEYRRSERLSARLASVT
ncbi:hypothetical protein [Streptomyces sp. NPDC127084]|uniref:hypothetical protein n=1 Tax=Streptomyces sp. NPDC127084 TaxID=3347133 RepID=UPI0036695C13